MDSERRDRLARESLDGSVSGPDAPLEATAAAVAKADTARTVVLVEGISDQLAVEALAERQGRDLTAEGVVIVPMAVPTPSLGTSPDSGHRDRTAHPRPVRRR